MQYFSRSAQIDVRNMKESIISVNTFLNNDNLNELSCPVRFTYLSVFKQSYFIFLTLKQICYVFKH